MSEESTNQRAGETGASSASLDVDASARRALAEQAVALVEDYFKRVPLLPIFPDKTSTDRLAGIIESRLQDEGEEIERIMDDCRLVIDASRQNGHPRFYGYVASPSTPVGAYADLIASALNSNVTSWRSAPAATEVERTVVRWLADLIGYVDNAAGLLTSGGSMANLTALLIAHRSRAPRDVSNKGLYASAAPMTLYASDQVHLSIPKAADILGLGREHVRIVKTDGALRLDVNALRERIEGDSRAGFAPFCVVASAGTVNTGAVDPLEDAASIAEEFGLWFHVDGAYGAPAAMDSTRRRLFQGMERADSLSIDAHKWLYAPVDCGCLLLRDGSQARAAFSSSEADYIKVHEEEEREAFAFWDYGIELSRRFRALKLWMMLRYYGARRLSQAVTHDNALAGYLAERVREADDFELLAPVSLSICCFRYLPRGFRLRLEAAQSAEERETINRELDEMNTRIMHLVQRGGRAYVSNATIGGRFSLRACITNFRTTHDDIDQTLEAIRDAAREIENRGQHRREQR